MAWFDEESREVRESVSKENFESWLTQAGGDIILTSEEWESVATDLENAINNALERLQETLVQDIIEHGGAYFE
jgi:hypothetical protein